MPSLISPSFFGKGPSFPLRLDSTSSKIRVSEDEELVRESIDNIINTDPLERPFLRRDGVPFGTNCRRVLFDSAEVALSIIRFEIKRGLDVWEPRIIVDSVDGEEVPHANGGSAILVDISFRYRTTNRNDNFVTPFRLQRST